MDWIRFNVNAIWCAGPFNMVGIFVGHHGTGHVLCDLRHSDGRLRLLLFNKTGEIFYFSNKHAQMNEQKNQNQPRTHHKLKIGSNAF